MKCQQINLNNLLDGLPDSVLVCTKSTEERKARPLYGNVKLNSFFGCDVVNSHNKSKLHKKDRKVKKQSPLERNIFMSN